MTMFLSDFSAPPEELLSLYEKTTPDEYRMVMFQVYDPSLVQIYPIYYAIWYESYMEGDYYKTQTVPFALQVVDNPECLDENNFALKPSPFPETISYQIGNPAIVFEWTYDDLANWLVYCGPKNLSIYKSDFSQSPAGLVTLYKIDDQGNNSLNVYTEDAALIGQHELVYVVRNSYYPNTYNVSPVFQVNVLESCVDATISQTLLPIQSYVITQPAIEYTMVEWETTPTHCALNYQLKTITPLLPGDQILFDPSTRTFTFYEASDVSLAKTYIVTVTASVENVSKDEIFFARLLNPCLDSEYTGIQIASQPPDQIYQINDSELWWTHDQFFSTHIPEQDTSLCGSISVLASMNDQEIDAISIPLAYEESIRTFILFSDWLDDAGDYIVTLLAYFTDYGSTSTLVITEISFKLTILYPPCTDPISIVGQPLENQSYVLTEPSLEYEIPAFTTNPFYCKVTYSIDVSPPFIFQTYTFDQETRIFSFYEDQDLSIADKKFNVFVTGIIGDGVNTIETKESFKLQMINPCRLPEYYSILTASLPQGLSYILYQSEIQFSHEAFTLEAEQNMIDLCGEIAYRARFEGVILNSVSTPMSYDDSQEPGMFKLYSEDMTLIGLRTLELFAYPSNVYEISDIESTIIEIIDPCIDPTSLEFIDAQTLPQDYFYTGDSPSLIFTTTGPVVVPSVCSIEYLCDCLSGPRTDICAVEEGSTVSSFDQTTGTLTFSTIDINSFIPGIYVIEITANSGSRQAIFQFDVHLVDPCPTADLNLLEGIITDMTYTLGSSTISQSWSSTASLFDPLTQVYCGDASVTFFLNDAFESPLDPVIFQHLESDSTLEVLESEDQQIAGTYEILFRITLTLYPENSAVSTNPLTITIVNPCDNPISLVPSSTPLQDQEYTITTDPVIYQAPQFIQEPSFCDIYYSFRVQQTVNLEQLIDFNADPSVREFTFWNAQDVRLAEIYEVTLVAQTGTILQNIIESTEKFNLTVKNPCIDPKLVQIESVELPQDIEYFLYQEFSFSHEEFRTVTSPFPHVLCGPLVYTTIFMDQELTPSSSPIAYDSQLTFSIYSEDDQLLAGSPYIITVQAYLRDYPSVKSLEPHQETQITFIEACSAPLSLETPLVDESTTTLTYQYTETPALIRPTPFLTNPPFCPVTYECMQISQPAAPFASIDCSDDGVVINFDQRTGELSIQTQYMERYVEGMYEVTIRGTVGISAKLQQEVVLGLVLENPCPNTVELVQQDKVSADQFGNYLYELGAESIQLDFSPFELTQLDIPGVNCGPIMLQFVDLATGIPLSSQLFGVEQFEQDVVSFRIVKQTNEASVGIYQIQVVAYLINYPNVSKPLDHSAFTVTIKKPNGEDDFNDGLFDVEPEWLQNLDDQSVNLGDDLVYDMGSRENEREESEVIITVSSRIKSIIEYDHLNNKFVVNGTLTEPDDVGTWIVKVQIVYYHPDYFYIDDNLSNESESDEEINQRQIIQSYQMSFTLEILQNVNPEDQQSQTNQDEQNIDEETEEASTWDQNQSSEQFNKWFKNLSDEEKQRFQRQFEMMDSIADFNGVVIREPQQMQQQLNQGSQQSGQTGDKNTETPMSRPVPYIYNISSRGVMTIAFDRTMKPIEDPSVIPPTKVAIDYDLFQNEMISNGRRRRLEGAVWFQDTEKDQMIRMMLMDAIDIKYVKDPNNEQLDSVIGGFQWDLINYSDNFLQIQLKFDHPEAIGSFMFKEYIEVTFWGVQFFKDVDGVEVKLGQQLRYQIQRQLDNENADFVEEILKFTDVIMFVACFALLFFLGINARMLPTWMFLNSIQLIVHSALLSTNMPSNLHHFLFHYLNLFRLNPEALDLEMEIWQRESGQIDYQLANEDDEYFSSVLGMCGYKHAFSRNLLIVIGISVVLLLVIFALIVIDKVKNRTGERRLSAYMCNFSVRFAYFFFLEICLSVLIHIASMQVMQKEHEAQVSISSWIIACIYLFGILIFIAFVISRLCINGPYIKNTYSQGSFIHSFWGIRRHNPTLFQCYATQTEVNEYKQQKAVALQQATTPKSLNINEIKLKAAFVEELLTKVANTDEQQYTLEDGTHTGRNLLKHGQVMPVQHDVLIDVDIEDENNSPIKFGAPDTFEGGEPTVMVLGKGSNNSTKDITVYSNLKEIKFAAKIRSRLSEDVKVSNSYRTLFYGLKWNHEHNVAVVHPLAYLLRRVLYALVIVFMIGQGVVIWGAFIILTTCLSMMIFVVHEAPWEDFQINIQHFANELVFYLVCCGLMSFSGVITESGPLLSFGWLLLALISTLILFNVAFIMFDIGKFIRLLALRYVQGHLAAKTHLKRQQKLNHLNQKKIQPLNTNQEEETKKGLSGIDMSVSSIDDEPANRHALENPMVTSPLPVSVPYSPDPETPGPPGVKQLILPPIVQSSTKKPSGDKKQDNFNQYSKQSTALKINEENDDNYKEHEIPAVDMNFQPVNAFQMTLSKLYKVDTSSQNSSKNDEEENNIDVDDEDLLRNDQQDQEVEDKPQLMPNTGERYSVASQISEENSSAGEQSQEDIETAEKPNEKSDKNEEEYNSDFSATVKDQNLNVQPVIENQIDRHPQIEVNKVDSNLQSAYQSNYSQEEDKFEDDDDNEVRVDGFESKMGAINDNDLLRALSPPADQSNDTTLKENNFDTDVRLQDTDVRLQQTNQSEVESADNQALTIQNQDITKHKSDFTISRDEKCKGIMAFGTVEEEDTFSDVVAENNCVQDKLQRKSKHLENMSIDLLQGKMQLNRSLEDMQNLNDNNSTTPAPEAAIFKTIKKSASMEILSERRVIENQDDDTDHQSAGAAFQLFSNPRTSSKGKVTGSPTRKNSLIFNKALQIPKKAKFAKAFPTSVNFFQKEQNINTSCDKLDEIESSMASIEVIQESNHKNMHRDSMILQTPSQNKELQFTTLKKTNRQGSQKVTQKTAELCDSLTVKAGPKFINSKSGVKTNRMKIMKPMKSLINSGNNIAN